MTYFSFSQRDTYHWDVVTRERRVFCIRGEPGDIYIRDERSPSHRDGPVTKLSFKTVDAAVAWITSELMAEVSHDTH